ncbi:putative serine/threonine-protein kinase At1g54610 [Apium graveolens]|uniref:putative serine/threonine-protein kinase At1g54610 n=1 Tax=Apium graveolens TaxID=4045 RepID=UPI003D7A5CAE
MELGFYQNTWQESVISFPSLLIFLDVLGSQLQDLLEKQGSELKQKKQLIPSLRRQVTSLTGQLHYLIEDLKEVDQLHRIFMIYGSPLGDYWRKLKWYPVDIIDPKKHFTRRVAPALALLESLLSIDPSARKSAVDALNSEFFLSEPPPSKPEELLE